jgi:hypothetical protein
MIDPYKGLNEWLNELDQKTKKVFFILIVVGFVLMISACSSMKEMAWTSGAALATGAAASVVTGTLPAVAAGAAAGGLTAAVISDAPSSLPSAPEQATSGWGALAVLFATSGKWLGICALAFIVLGWLVPSPFKLNKRDTKTG